MQRFFLLITDSVCRANADLIPVRPINFAIVENNINPTVYEIHHRLQQ
jgi:hypothetical protein